jgi:hypothetical protein
MCLERVTQSLVKIDEHSRLERKKIMDDMQEKHNAMMVVLDSFAGIKEEPINYKDLVKFPLFEWIVLNDKVSIQRRNMLFGNYINFDTHIKAGGEFGKHFHEDVIESCEVMKGSVLDTHDNVTYNEGDVMHYLKGQHHRPICLVDCELRVIFKP